ncbi:DUF2330 domain-containing protein [Brachybacterium sp. DNPG3]
MMTHRPAFRSPARRLLHLVLAALAATTMLLTIGAAGPAGACACGGYVDPVDQRADAVVTEETVVLSLRDGIETMVMGIELDGSRTGSALLLPTPSVPEVSAGASGTLREIAQATAPREVIVHDYWGDSPFAAGSGDGAAPGAPQPTEGAAAPVTVHEEARVGDFEIAVLEGGADGVRDWLAENGYALPEEVGALLDPYAEEGWTFTAVRYAEDAVLTGEVEPLRFDFATDELIYPMRLSQAATSRQSIHLFVLDEEPVRRSDLDGLSLEGLESVQTVERPWIGEPDLHDWAWSDATLRELVGLDRLGSADYTGDDALSRSELHRVVTEFAISGDPETFTTDFTFVQDPDAEDVIPTYETVEVVEIAGIPVGWLLVGLGIVTAVAVLVAGIAVALAVRATRRARTAVPSA